ncbi:MAG: calcium-dependent protein kinase 21 [Silanimonas sp.]
MSAGRVLLLGLVLVSAPAAGATPTGYAQGPGELLQRFDADADGRVDEAEYVAYLSLGFRARDVDHNGVLEGEELPPNAKPITRADSEARLRRQFARQDSNADGRLDARELLAPPRG